MIFQSRCQICPLNFIYNLIWNNFFKHPWTTDQIFFIRCIKIAIYLCYKKKYCSTMHHEHLHVGVSNYNTSCFKTILRPLVKVIAWFEFHKVYTYFTFLFINCSKIVNLFILLVLNNLLSHTCHYLTLCCWFNPFINETFE